jgi:hypothetical protein
MAKTSKSKAEPDPKGKAQTQTKAEPERKDNRYLRTARVIIEARRGRRPRRASVQS